MNQETVQYLCCSNCGSDQLHVESYIPKDREIWEGRIDCLHCRTWYRIEQGILDLLPLSLRDYQLYESFAAKYHLVIEKRTSEESTDGKSSQAEFFHESADDYEKRVVQSHYYQALDELVFHTWVQAKLKPGMRVLELGAGTGRQCIPIAKNKSYSLGIDISESMLQLARKKIDEAGLGEYIDLIVGDAENPPVKNNLFDALLFYGVLHHLPHKNKTIQNAVRKLKSGGHYMSLDPHDSPVRFIFDFLMHIWKLWDEEASEAPLLSERQLQQWMKESGIQGTTRLSTYLPPYFFYWLNRQSGRRLLQYSDTALGRIPGIRKLGGVIVAEGIKESQGKIIE